MIEKIKLATYVKEHQKELDEIMQNIFKHWNEIGKLHDKEEVQNKMQITFLTSIIRIWLTTAGIPKPHQKQILEQLYKSL